MRAAQSPPLGSHAGRALLPPWNPLVGEIHASRVSPQVNEWGAFFLSFFFYSAAQERNRRSYRCFPRG
jgi:hypothetical protein